MTAIGHEVVATRIRRIGISIKVIETQAVTELVTENTDAGTQVVVKHLRRASILIDMDAIECDA